MRQQVIWVHPAAPTKPALGQPCNGCGVCCLAEPCPVGMVLSRRCKGACVALRWSEASQRYVCGALVYPRETWGLWSYLPGLRGWVSRAIAAGKGCDASFDAAPHAPITPTDRD